MRARLACLILTAAGAGGCEPEGDRRTALPQPVPACGAEVRHEVSWGAAGPFGSSPDDLRLAATAGGPFVIHYEGDFGGGESPLTLELERGDGMPELVESASCPARLTLPVVVRFATDDGAFDERFAEVLATTGGAQASLPLLLPAGELRGNVLDGVELAGESPWFIFLGVLVSGRDQGGPVFAEFGGGHVPVGAWGPAAP